MKKEVSPTQKALNLWALILIGWSIYRAYLKMPDWFDEFIAKPIIFVLPVYYYIKKVEKTGFFEGLNIDKTGFAKDFFDGLLIGIVFLASGILANFLKSKKLALLPASIPIGQLFYLFFLALATAISEEILSRGFVLKRLYQESQNIFSSSFFASLLFFFLHVPILFTNLKIGGNLLILFMITDIALSLVLSFIFLMRKSLTFPILIHAFYNLVITLFV